MKKNKNLFRNLIMIVYLIVVFVVTCVISAHFLSQGTVDMTTDMSEPTLPIMHIKYDGYDINYMYGYTQAMECAYMRDVLSVIGTDRKVSFSIDCYDSKVDEMLFEVRSIDGERLIESTEVYNYAISGKTINGSITIKDLVSAGDEYMLIFILGLHDGTTARYYSRLIMSDNYHVSEKVAFVDDFVRKTFNKEEATELTKYLESNSQGDNSSFNKVNIHSSFNQVTWGNLEAKLLGNPRIGVSELTSATGYFKVNYQVAIEEDSKTVVCNVIEYFRIRYTTDRIYLLNWERECNQIFDETEEVYFGNQIDLGIVGTDVEITECDGGNIFTIVDEGKLVCVNASEGKVVRLYSFYTDDLSDLRGSNQNYKIHVLNVDETGNVIFSVYGYMNRGTHEGRVGMAVFDYNSDTNTIEEKAYVDYTRSAEMLMTNISELSYVDRDDRTYFMLERTVYALDQKNNSLMEMASALQDDSYKVSKSGRMIAWQNDGDLYSCTKLRLMNLSSGISEDVKAGYGEYIRPLGFMGEDLVYGVARTKEVYQDMSGNIIFPMYKIVIRSDIGEILKEYARDGIYIMDCEISDGQMYLTRAKYSDKSENYIETDSDQIMSTEIVSDKNNKLNPVVTEKLETVIQVTMKDSIKDNSVINYTPREVMYEGSRELYRQNEIELGCYNVYGLKGYETGFIQAGNAVNYAYDISGLVLDGKGRYVWLKTTRAGKNQIMAISEPDKVDAKQSMAECIDAMLRFEGVTTNSRVLLSQGQSAQTILENYLGDDKIVLNLSGCSMDAILYYVNKDIPVLAIMNDSSAFLITGFNDSQVVLFDPAQGELRKVSMTEADNMFKANGNTFMTYMK